jgi:hypothetical protein
MRGRWPSSCGGGLRRGARACPSASRGRTGRAGGARRAVDLTGPADPCRGVPPPRPRESPPALPFDRGPAEHRRPAQLPRDSRTMRHRWWKEPRDATATWRRWTAAVASGLGLLRRLPCPPVRRGRDWMLPGQGFALIRRSAYWSPPILHCLFVVGSATLLLDSLKVSYYGFLKAQFLPSSSVFASVRQVASHRRCYRSRPFQAVEKNLYLCGKDAACIRTTLKSFPRA